MPDRYINIGILKNSLGKRYYKTTLYPKIEPSETDYYIETVMGDRLDLLANEFYGDVSLYWIISISNNIPHDSLYLPPGTQLRIPTDINKIKQKFKELNNNR